MSDGNESDVMPSRIVAKMGKLDGSDMGKGRRKPSGEDSSSSREASPDRTRRRSFSPRSDDEEDVAVPPNEDEDTPEPDAPVIRQAMAFPAPLPLATYEAPAPSRVATAVPTHFLPGQAVSAPSPAPSAPQSPQRGARGGGKRRARGRTRHYNDEFSDKTGSFRLTGWVNDPKTSRLDARPYAQMYRAPVSAEAAQPAGSQSTALSASSPASTQVSLSVFSAVGSNETASTSSVGFHTGSFGSVELAYPVTALAASPPASISSLPTSVGNTSVSSSTLSTATPATGNAAGSSTKSTRRVPKRMDLRSASSVQSSSEQSRASRAKEHRGSRQESASSTITPTLGSHYRRDYDRGTELALARASARAHAHASHSPSQSSFESSSHSRSHRSAVSARNPSHHSSSNMGDPSLELTRVQRVTRMVTLLIEDVRSGVTDNQLAEVYVPLRAAEDPNDGFWADAHDISQALQSSPARIDGPAKVYAMRRKYRQFFLRVSADNVDTMTSANLIVSKVKTLEIVVEPPPAQDGSLPQPPPKPHRLTRVPSPDRDASPSPPSTPQAQRPRDTDRGSSYRKRRRSVSSSSSHDSDSESTRSRRHEHHRHSRRRTSSLVSQSSSDRRHRSSAPVEPLRNVISRRIASFPDSLRTADGQLPSWAQIPPSREPTPQPDVPQEQVDEAISRAIQPDIGQDEYWVEFMRLKAIPPPLTAPDTLKQYRFVQKKVNEWQGRIAPFKSARHIVEKKHVMKALFLDDRWGSECTETLELIELYGPDGDHDEDPRVAVMLEDTSPPKGRPAKKLLRVLREIHQNWLKEHQSESAAQGGVTASSKGKEREVDSR